MYTHGVCTEEEICMKSLERQLDELGWAFPPERKQLSGGLPPMKAEKSEHVLTREVLQSISEEDMNKFFGRK
jgi:hypothetical protein